jgi:CRISPR/Cas system-associated endonuclease Cas1
LISAKLRNYAVLARATPGADRAPRLPNELEIAARDAEQASSLAELLGVEGAGAARWFSSLNGRLANGFHFDGRRAPCADDPVNVLLNIAQTALNRQMILAVIQAGLEPSVGLLHQWRSGHPALASDLHVPETLPTGMPLPWRYEQPALASDLQEPFRHLMDRVVIEATARFSPKDFHKASHGPFPSRITFAAARQFQVMIHQLFARPVKAGGQSEAKPYRLQFVELARALRRHLLSPDQPFWVFTHLSPTPAATSS